MRREDVRNLAIIAHVDHGKTTLVDGMLRQAGIFRENQEVVERIMDSNALERERGITILAKNTSFVLGDIRVNVVDTPGHADFGGEVERSLAVVDGVLLLVDASEGPLPQTRFVLRKALEKGLPAIVAINKIDRPDARIAEVLDEVYSLFIDLDATEQQIEFPVLYTNAKRGTAQRSMEEEEEGTDLKPLFEAILALPGPEVDPDAPAAFQVNNLDYDDYVGRLAVGRMASGTLLPNRPYVRIGPSGEPEPCKVTRIYGWRGLERVPIERADAGDIVMIAGVEELTISDTITDPEKPVTLPRLRVDEPTIAMVFSVNDSPWAGREGKNVTSRKLRERIELERLRNVSIRIEDTGEPDSWRILGRGELALAVLAETMRREGYEIALSRPTIVTKEEDGQLLEPIELVVIDVPEDYVGVISQLLSVRKGRMLKLEHEGEAGTGSRVRLEFRVPTRGLIGFRQQFLTDTRGTGILNTLFDGWAPWSGPIPGRPNGAIVSDREGVATGYALFHLEDRGTLFVPPGTPVYEGMVIGEYTRQNNLDVNVCREKKLTNIRAAGKDEAIRLTPPHVMTLDLAIEWIDDDELVEVTPKSVRIRKRILATNLRPKIRGEG